MNVLNLATETSNNLPKMVVVYRGQPKMENPVKAARNKFTLKSVGAYLHEALAESLKQNLLGSDVNMEFLVLSARVYLIRFVNFAVIYPKNRPTNNKPVTRNGAFNILNDRPFSNPLKLISQ